MYDPKKVFTPEGYEDYRLHLRLMEKAVGFLINNADDLHIGGTDNDEELLYKMEAFVGRMLNGPWTEEYDGPI